MRALAAVAVSVGLLAGAAVAMADNTSIVKLVSFENPHNGLGAFTYRWTLGATINSVTRVDHPAWSATGDGAAQINCTFGGYGDKAVAGATFYSASSGSAGMSLANLGYNYLLAAVAVDDNATFVPNGLIIKMYDKTGPGWLYRSGGDTGIASANTWYLLAWPISGAGDLTDVRELGIDMWSDAPYSGNVYVNFLGASPTNVPEPATLSLLALGGLLIARRRAARALPILIAAGLLAGVASSASADVFNMPSGKSLEFVTVGNPGNTSDPRTGLGSVSTTYKMGKFDVTAAQYCQFLNATARTGDPYSLYTSYMYMETWPGACGIARNGSYGNYYYTTTKNPDYPVNYLSWGSAARFCNWLANGQPTGVQGPGTTETGSYTMNGALTASDLMGITRNAGARYVIPTQNEWYKAAYHKGGSISAGYWTYATQSDMAPSNVLDPAGTNNANYYLNGILTDPVNHLTPVGAFAGSPSAYGTYDQNGNVFQWTETAPSYATTRRIMRGGPAGGSGINLDSSHSSSQEASDFAVFLGFRIALVPEPATLSLVLGGLLVARRRRG